MEISLRGIGVSPGIAIGRARRYHVTNLEVPRRSIEDPASELARYDEAAAKARASLVGLKEQTADELGEQHAAIFLAHIDLLEDVALRPEIERRLKEEKLNVEYLLNDLIAGYTKMLDQVEDPLFRERSLDLVDVGRRLLANLLEEELESLEHLADPCIIVANEVTPSEAANMDLTNLLALTTDAGGPTSHVSILTRAFEVPSVVGLRSLGARVKPDDLLIVDGGTGFVILNPRDETLERYAKKKQRMEEERLALAEAATEGPSVTSNGKEIPTYANIELLHETRMCKRARCQGVGLYRTEFLFINRTSLPTEDEQYEYYRKVMEAMAPLPVTVRTLDLGGDKALPGLSLEREANPQLGWRSIRMCLDRPDVFKAQLRALFRASVHGEMRIMFPMITGMDQLLEAKQVAEEVKDDLRRREVPFDESTPIGSMIEVPAAALIADRLAQECDFFSIGSNDLIQYCLAADRGNRRTAHLYQPTHLSVLRLLKQTLVAAKEANIPCSICGEMAGDPVVTELLLGLGFESLSMSSVSLPIVRAEIMNIHLATAKRLARKVMDMKSASEIQKLLQERYTNRGTLEHLRKVAPKAELSEGSARKG